MVRGILIKAMSERGIREGLMERMGELIKETRNRVRTEGIMEDGFQTARGVKQGCPLSPLLFNILVADLEEKIKVK